PAWTLGIELIFYMVAPLIVTKKMRIFILLAISLVFSFVFYDIKFLQVFFLFVLGTVSYQLYVRIKSIKTRIHPRYLVYILFSVFAFFLASLIFFPHLLIETNSVNPINIIYYFGLAGLIPFI